MFLDFVAATASHYVTGLYCTVHKKHPVPHTIILQYTPTRSMVVCFLVVFFYYFTMLTSWFFATPGFSRRSQFIHGCTHFDRLTN